MRLRRWLAILPLAVAPLAAAPPAEAATGFAVLTFVCPNPYQIDFSWTPATNATFYALQLVGPLDPAANGSVTGTYVRQFGVVEVANGSINSASVTLSPGSLQTNAVQWQLMIGDANGYSGVIPRQQVAIVPVPCPLTTPRQSPYR